MNSPNLTIAANAITAGAGAAVFAALLIWWLIRKKRKRLWLPTLRIIDLESKRLPKLRVTPPPLIAFLCFAIAALSYWFFSARPSSLVSAPADPRPNKVHILADMSPSVSARISISAYAAKVAGLVQNLEKDGRVSVSTTHSFDIIKDQDAAAIEQRLITLGFHRSGTKLGEFVRHQIETLGDVERLLIVSDGERFSWEDLNWRFLAEDMEVLLVPVAENLDRTLPNVFIDKAAYQPTPDTNLMTWDLDIARTDTDQELSGILKVTQGTKGLAAVPWRFAPGRGRVTLQINWPTSKLTDDLNQEPLKWDLEASSGNALKADDTFRSLPRGIKQDLLVISEPRGEMFLDDSSHHLEIALSAMGFNIKRLDHAPRSAPELFDLPLWILLGGTSGVDDFCPSEFESRRLANLAAGTTTAARPLPKIWLAPQDENANFRDICWCFSRLAVDKTPKPTLPVYCEDVQTRDQWVQVLASLGAKQIGGELGDNEKSVAWLVKNEAAGTEVLAFSVPLKPTGAQGLSFTGLPLLTRSLLSWQKLTDAGTYKKSSEWLRISDLTATIGQEAFDLRRDLSNVPAGESLLSPAATDSLPPTWSSQLDSFARQLPLKNEEQDPTPWLNICALLIILACGVEALHTATKSLWRIIKKRRAGALLLLLFMPLALPEPCEARIAIAKLSAERSPERIANLAREVLTRTSIDLTVDISQHNEIDDTLLLNPWIFAANINLISDSSGHLNPKLASWIKRGGFLVIEGGAGADTLAKLSEASLVPAHEGEGWQVVPPDHELMRSFHLIDALPTCPGQVWRGYQYDGRLAILAIPFSFLNTLLDQPRLSPCAPLDSHERAVRTFINLLMVALATDYKKDQIHLPEILKRLR